MTLEVMPQTLSAEDLKDLSEAVRLLETETLAGRLTSLLGRQVQFLGRVFPSPARRAIAYATERALKAALHVAIRSLRTPSGQPAGTSRRWHKAAAVASGAVGGAFGLPALAIELPLSTTILMRSIADIARSEGEDLSDPEALLACVEVFALGGREPGESTLEGNYFAVRAALAQSVNESARFLLHAGLGGETAPIVVRALSQIAARFGIAVSEKVAAQATPILGAVGGAAINAAFAEHFQTLARAHFIVRRLERRHGAEAVEFEYRRLSRTSKDAPAFRKPVSLAAN